MIWKEIIEERRGSMKNNKKQSTQNQTILKVLKYISKYKGYVISSIILAGFSVALTLYAPILIGDAIDLVIGKGNVNFSAISTILIQLAIIIVLTALCQWIMNICNNKVTYHVIQDIRKDAFYKIQELPLKYLDGQSSGDIVSRVIADADQFAEGLLMGCTQLFTGVMTILGTLIFMFSQNIGISLVVVLVTPVSLFVASFIAKKTFSMFQLQSKTRGEQTALIDEMIGNQKVVKAYGYEKQAKERFYEINNRLQTCSLQAIFFSSTTNPSTRFINSIVYMGVVLFGAFSVIGNTLTIGQLSCFLTYANQYTKPFNEISSVITELQNALACAGRIFELIEEPSQIPDKETITNTVVIDSKEEERNHITGNIALEHVYFSYSKDRPLIEDFNLSVTKGQKVAIVGPTGCGKTTLINLLMRFYDVDSGTIKIDQVSTKDMTHHKVRENFGMVLQDTWLKAGTIADNISMGKEGITRDDMIEAAKMTQAHHFIKRLPKGYDTVIAEDGGDLSQGQKQLLCITRVMLSKPPMLILDEATSSIDTRTELMVQNAFHKLMEGKTSFIVAHRLSTIQEADVILVMKDGRIIEQGNHATLLEQKGFYAHLYESQFALS